jgi:transcriptional regulator with XRE-family HTH domain
MRQQIPRHNAIGKKIREARKMRSMTLEELAEGICSLGKMSHIENGHRPVTYDELIKFSEKLNFPISHFSDPDINDKVRELDLYKQKIGDFIGLQHWDTVKSELIQFKKKIEEYHIPTRMIDYHFLSGIFYIKTNQKETAKKCLTNVIEEEENSKYNLKLKLKSYSALSSLSFSEKKVSKSMELINMALEISKESPTILKEERDNINYNRSILYLYIGEIFKSLNSVNKVNHHIINTLETDYIKLLIRFLDEDLVDDIEKDLLSLRENFLQTNDQEGILRGWALTMYSLINSQPNDDFFNRLKESFLFDMSIVSKMEKLQENSLGIYQLVIHVCLINGVEKSFVEKLIDNTKTLLPKITNKLLIARNFYLEGKFHNEFLQNSISSLSLFEQALTLLNEDYEGFFKADILYEIYTLKEPESISIAKQALELYHEHQKSKFLYTHFHELILPPFKY